MFWESLLFRSHSELNLLPLATSKKTQDLFNNPSILLKRSNFLNLLRTLLISVAFYSKFVIFSRLQKLQVFLSKTNYILNKPKFWTFWETLLFWSQSETNLPLLVIFEKIKILFWETRLFLFSKKNNFRTTWEMLLFQSHSTANLLPLAIFKNFKFHFQKKICFF